MRIRLLSLFILAAFYCNGQKEANTWYFGTNAGLDFSSGSPVPLSNGKTHTNEGCASIADKTTGQLLFYSEGDTIWDRNHDTMPNGTGLLANGYSTQSALIIPMPGSDSLFYVFTVDAQAGYIYPNASKTGYGGVAYSIVDMSLNSGNGAVTTKNVHLLTKTSEKLTAVRHCNGIDIWVVIHQWNTNAFYSYLITNSGISAPVISNSGIIHRDIYSLGFNDEAVGYMKFSPNGKKLALACNINVNTVQIFDFNNSSGGVSNPITDADFDNISGIDGPYGICFSPDNSRLYVGAFGDNIYGGNSYVYQYNMLAGSSAAIVASKTELLKDTVRIGALQAGPDGKIYVAKSYSYHGSEYLDVINNPNSLGAACNYSVDGLYLGGVGTSNFGLPDMVESFTTLPYSASLNYTTCTRTDAISLSDSNINGTISVLWNFDDPASGTEDTSSLQFPAHTFATSGPHKVTLYVGNTCKTDTLFQTIIADSIIVDATPDTAVCSGNQVHLHSNSSIGTAITWHWFPSTKLNDTTSANPTIIAVLATTTYTVTGSSGNCSSTATVTAAIIDPPPIPQVSQSGDTIFFNDHPSYTQIEWSDTNGIISGATDTFLVAMHNGNYTIKVTNEGGCSIATVVNVTITGLQTNYSKNIISLSPNPATDRLIISGSWSSGRSIVTIYNVPGEVVYYGELHAINNELSHTYGIDVSEFSGGMYFVRVQTISLSNSSGLVSKPGDEIWIGKFIKE